MKTWIAIAFLALSGCATSRLCDPRDFVCWDAMSDAANAAADSCAGGHVEPVEGAEGTSPDDYRCVPDPTQPQPQPER
jgi:hypothetical protein